METKDLLNKIRENDFGAYTLFYQKYGHTLREFLQKQCPDQDSADVAFNETMSAFYAALSESRSDDALEVLLFACAGQACQKAKAANRPGANGAGPREKWPAALQPPAAAPARKPDPVPAEVPQRMEASKPAEVPKPAVTSKPVEVPKPAETPKQAEIPRSEEKKEKSSGSFVFVLMVLMLLVCIAAVLWIMAGVLMGMKVIPELDLGYTWFNANVIPWF